MGDSGDDFATPMESQGVQCTPKRPRATPCAAGAKSAEKTAWGALMRPKRRRESAGGRAKATEHVMERQPDTVLSSGSNDVPSAVGHSRGPRPAPRECPMCGTRFQEAFLEAHVNLCLDKSASGRRAPAESAFASESAAGTPAAGDQPGRGTAGGAGGVDAGGAEAADPAATPRGEHDDREAAGGASEVDGTPAGAGDPAADLAPDPGAAGGAEDLARVNLPLTEFLKQLGLGALSSTLVGAGYGTVQSLRLIGNEELEGAGVTALGARKKILVELGALFRERKQLGIGDSAVVQPSPPPAGKVRCGPTSTCTSGSAKLFPIFESPKNTPEKKLGASKAEGRATARDHAFCKRVEGTTFTVDSFKAKPGACRQFFLSHFHGDHYGGLTKSFNAGVVLCTEVTAKLVESRLRVPKHFIQVLELNVETFLPDLGAGAPRGRDNGAYVTAVEANHCPGACMFLFRVQSTGQTVLHSGDCRFDAEIFGTDACLRKLLDSGRQLDVLHLDTTYCDPKYRFPKQSTVIEAVLAFMRRESFNSRTLFLFGSYQIGKEKLYLRVAKELNMKVFIDPYRARALATFGLEEQVLKLLTTDASQARIHIGPMSLASWRGATTRLREHRTRFSNVIAVRPTGWTWTPSGSSSTGKGVSRQQRGNCIIYQVAYSEHSSFNELQEFVRMFRPRRLIPTVGVRARADATKMRRLLNHIDQF